MSKIHRIPVTEANPNFDRSITINEDLIETANFLDGEPVQIMNNNDDRLVTDVITGRRGSGAICLNEAAARGMHLRDILIIMPF